ncbi:PAS domain-containing protein [Paenibacillus woosongensis]|uniref:PAS domain-containing protein n=1 Tax=Paenibacillus woosongensis TaxID=307580 RepID=A0AA95IBN4_9BACL|nr:PAS domain-containing protein [Paenibacillus woosongensis]WHX51019.1 PAS domain-containing protein [Paenibacillus woosongensis]
MWDRHYIVNYKATGPRGQQFRSSTYFIKNTEGTLVGLMCLNIAAADMDLKAPPAVVEKLESFA